METKMNLKSLLLGAALGLSALPALADIVISQPYARAASPHARSGAAFMVITNTGPEADRLIGADTTAAKKAGLHINVMENGIAKMPTATDGFEIAPGGELRLARGGKHVMLMGLTAPFVQGGSFILTLHFEKAGDIEVAVPIDNARAPGAAGMDMDGMSNN
jgi:copper(I)-binding protein